MRRASQDLAAARQLVCARDRRFRSLTLWLAGCIVSLLCTTAMPAEEQAEFFHQKVEPILRQHCYDCHSHQAGQMESGLRLTGRAVG